jgi:hypothetical protein
MAYTKPSFEAGKLLRLADQARDQGHDGKAIELYRQARGLLAPCKDIDSEAGRLWQVASQELQKLGG